MQRSANGSDFVAIGIVQAAGNSAIPQQYQWLDVEPLSGRSWYRIRQVDLNATYTYSKAIPIFRNQPPEFGVSPNPTRGQVRLFVPSYGSANYLLQVSDAAGRMVLQRQLIAGNAVLDCSTWGAGNYWITLYQQGRLIGAQLVVKQ